jgi:hypothetical protein
MGMNEIRYNKMLGIMLINAGKRGSEFHKLDLPVEMLYKGDPSINDSILKNLHSPYFMTDINGHFSGSRIKYNRALSYEH